ncbi:MAG: hypothetical protein IJU10_03055 [Clostridia bacterium]|nr:hypothetical protein [Clostridia bacterium]
MFFQSYEGTHAFTMKYGVLDIIRSIYAGVGNFTFEGVDGLYDKSIAFGYQLCFYGSSLLTAIMFVSVIAATANYEIYSRFSLFFKRWRSKLFHKKYDYYVFTALTKETILLAESIAGKREETLGDGEKPTMTEEDQKNAVIIFAGPDLDSFDRKDELCRQVMANGFAYWSYNESEKSLTNVLKLNVHNGLDSWGNFYKFIKENENTVKAGGKAKKTDPRKKPGRLVICSFNAKNHVPMEEENMEFVFTDVKRHIKEIKEKHKEKQIKRILEASFIEYYVLSEREVNYQAYQHKVDLFRFEIENLVAPFFLKKWRDAKTHKDNPIEENWRTAPDRKDFDEALFDADIFGKSNDTFRFFKERKMTNAEVLAIFSYISNDSVWNEATAISYSAVEAFQQVLNQYPIADDFLGGNIHVCSVGYGLTAQTIVKNLYVQTAYISSEEDFVSTFHVEAYDPAATDIAGLLQYENPMTVCFEVENTATDDSGKRGPKHITFNAEQEDELRKECAEIGEDYEKMRPEDKLIVWRIKEIRKAAIDSIRVQVPDKVMTHDREISPMAITLHKISVLDFDFVKKLDEYTGTGSDKIVRPEFITIATGDDYHNIKIANALIIDILKEQQSQPAEKVKKQIIFMNVWDEKNLALINTYNANIAKNVRGGKEDLIDPSTEYKEIRGAKVYHYSDSLILIVVGSNNEIYSAKSVIAYREIAQYAVNYDRASNMSSLMVNLYFDQPGDDVSANKRYYNDQNRLPEGKKPVEGVKMKISEAVNRIVADYCTGRELPFSEEVATNILATFCTLSTWSEKKLKEVKITKKIDREKNTIKTMLSDALDRSDAVGFFDYIRYAPFLRWCNWCRAQLWEKESNMSAHMFGYVYKRLYQKRLEKKVIEDKIRKEQGLPVSNSVFTLEEYIRIINIEHQRWMRLHMCNGWTSGSTVKARRTHGSIVPLYGICLNGTYAYDLINAAWGMKKE